MSSMPVLGGRYRLLNRLGRGGMSVVWRGWDQVLDRPVAVKLLAGAFTGAAGRERFRAEARTAARLSHPHICQVFDYGESRTESGEHVAYIVMELLSGATLGERLRAGPMPLGEALQVAAQVASALAAAHSCGLVHRDIKPANVMMTPAGPKVVDFGIAAAVGTPDKPRSDGMQGTPAYLAPERLLDGQVMPASDVYALGIVIYRMVSGAVPWPAETVTQMLEAHQYQEPAPLPPVDGLPETVAQLCQRCLAKDPRERPTAHEVARRLAEAVGWRVSRAGEELIEANSDDEVPEPAADTAATEPRSAQPDPAPGPPPRRHARRSRRRLALLAAAVVVAAVAAVAGATALTGDSVDRYEPGGAAPPADPSAGPGTHPAGAGSPFPSGDQVGGPVGPTGTGGGEPGDRPGDPSTAPGGGVPEPDPGESEAPEEPPRDPSEEVVETPGGTVLARCDRSRASVEPVELAPGFQVVEETSGPGVVRASIVLASVDERVQVDLECRSGEPDTTVHVE